MNVYLNNAIKKAEKLNDTRLFAFLSELSYTALKSNDLILYKDLFLQYLNHNNPDVKSVCFEALMMGLGLNNEYLEQQAIRYIKMADNEYGDLFFLQITCISCIKLVNMATKRSDLIDLFYNLFSSNVNDSGFRSSCFNALLGIYFGYNTIDISQINGKSPTLYEEINLDRFKNEIDIIKRKLGR